MFTLANERLPKVETARRTQRAPLGAPLVFVLCGVMWLTSCAVGPKYTRPAVQTPPAYKEASETETAAAANWTTAQPNDAAIRGNWWEIFNDPALNDLEAKANASNQNIAAAAANFLAARALVREARSQYFPTIGTTPTIVNQRPSPAQFGGLQSTTSSAGGFSVRSFTYFALPFDATWEPDLWGRVRNTVRGNVAAAQASAADLQNVRLSVQAELAADYYELRAQDSLKQIFDSTVVAYQDAYDMNATLYRSGVGTDEAVAQAEAQLKAAQAQDTNLGILRAQYEHGIAVLTGVPPANFTLPPANGQAIAPGIPVGVPSQLLERRPDIAAAERAMAQANAQIGVAKSAYYPSLLLSATGGFETSSITDWFTWPSRFWSVGPTLAETIFDAGLRSATMQQYRAQYDQTVATYRQTVLTSFQQVEDNLAALRLLSQDIQQQDAAVEAAGRSLQEANTRYRAGLDPYLNVISAQTVLLADQQTAVTFRMQQMVASVQLVKALGGGWNVREMPTPQQISSNLH